ncbi:carboxypeptidase-like regulatory domain-containing protein [uncultured Olleya sp.]|uniref:carboxypeptidase-like regulatory domain-containing protein n=1 Tax=uncultured Olleya sp. TaxID=757243 RepID=UPI0025945941|nr:carboxypeptidase-like regulatory domain-containing protein [uncultured Olleya sp.]
MKHLIKGTLYGMLCQESSENLANVEVRLYLPLHKSQLEALNNTNAKDTFHIVTEQEAQQREKLLIAKTTTDQNGAYQFEINEKYVETAFDLDFICHTLPNLPDLKPKDKPVHCHITTIQPEWTYDTNQNSSFSYNYGISQKLWCYIRGFYFDAWVISGYLRNCTSGNPIANATVQALDADLLNDDLLGTTTTNTEGYFRIDYTSNDFKKTFLSPWINVETEVGLPITLKSGPDVYFKAFLGDIKYIDETSENRRNNVSYCLCVSLCTKVIVTTPNQTEVFPSAWTGIGTAFNAVFGSGSKDFDVNGYAGTNKYGLTESIELTGQAAPTINNNPIEYRFRLSSVTTPNNEAAPDDDLFDIIVGVTDGLFVKSKVAVLQQKVAPFYTYDVESNLDDFDEKGWFDINSAIARTVSDNALGDINDYFFIDSDTLIKVNTAKLTNQDNVPIDSVDVGNAFPETSKLEIKKFAIKFEIREVINKEAEQFNRLPGSGKTLNSVVINNNSTFIKMNIDKLMDLGDCAPISGIINALYTVYHPLLLNVKMKLINNGRTFTKTLTDHFLPLEGNTDDNVNTIHNEALQINNTPNDLGRCTYKLTLSVNRRLHTGNDVAAHEEKEIYFFYDVS